MNRRKGIATNNNYLLGWSVVRMQMSKYAEAAKPRANSSPLQLGTGERWYVVMTQFRKESFALSNLVNQGFHCFAPRLVATRKHARRVSTWLAPVFPQYLFVVLDPAIQQWRAVNGTLGVRWLITNGDVPVPVPVGVVETLLTSCDAEGILACQSAAFKPGDRVKLVAGPFAGVYGSLLSLDASGRVRLLLEIMNGKISASADISAIVAEP